VCLPVVLADENNTYNIKFEDIVTAYYECCSNKRNSKDCLRFQGIYEVELVRIWNELCSGTYRPGISKCFVVTWPVYREVFAANFADRVVHHWWAIRVNPLFENLFHELGDVSMNCRKGFGTLKAVESFRAMADVHPDWWIGKFDFLGFFMNIDKNILWEKLSNFLIERYKESDLQTLLYVTKTIIFHCPQDLCIKKSDPEKWEHIPPNKTLFGQPKNKGCAIGNLSSQLMANFLGSFFDFFMVRVMKIKYYLRFVDDFVILVPHKIQIIQLIPKMEIFLSTDLHITLHPKKRHIQPASKGILYIGAYIHPGRTYISNRTRGKMYDCITRFNYLAEEGKAEENAEKFISSMNSYLGMMIHYDTYNIRSKIRWMIHKDWWKYMYMEGHFTKFVLKKRYKPNIILKEKVKNHKIEEFLRF